MSRNRRKQRLLRRYSLSLFDDRIIHLYPETLFNLFFFSVNGRRFGNDSCSGVPRCFTLSPVYHGPDDECTRQKPHKRLVNTNHRIPSLLPSHVPSRRVKLLLSVCLRLGLDIGGESSLRPPASPLLPSFPFSSLLLFDLLKPLSAASLLPHTSRMQDLCLCGCVCVLSRGV